MRTTLLSAGLSIALLAGASDAAAEGPPEFFRNALPEHAIDEILAGYGALQGEGAALDAKTRELIALAVAAQIPCQYCVYAHGREAEELGASKAELREAVAMAGYIRMWSTVLQGAETDFEAFRVEHDKMRAGGS